MKADGGYQRYHDFTPIQLDDRRWPSRVIESAPRWLSTDLRDGNQALATPMSPERKLALFSLLTGMGYREIEVGFPAASQDDYEFVRLLIEQDRIPDDVRISVMVPAREELIERTAQSLRGAARATMHVYNATSPLFRELVFGLTRPECRRLAVTGTRLMMKYAETYLSECDLGYEYSPELFNETEPDFSLEVCEAVMDVWQPGPDREIVLNFPATVERSLPNVFADQIEWLDRNLSRREHVCLSVHPHNDRGTGVASAEMALLAGAQRIEGCLFGCGERAGNVCLVTLGLNLFTHGVDPGIDFSRLGQARQVVEKCTGMAVPPRHPYAGDLVYTAFSGAHQDAIKKGFDALERQAEAAVTTTDQLPWEVPYLPLDPRDVGRSYEALVRINTQSGKSGAAYVLGSRFGLHLPRPLQADFGQVVQAAAETAGRELAAQEILRLFRQTYMVGPAGDLPVEPVPVRLFVDGATAGDLARALSVWGIDVEDVQQAGPVTPPEGQHPTVYARCFLGGRTRWGAGLDPDPLRAAWLAVCAAGVARGPAPLVPADGAGLSVPRQRTDDLAALAW